MKNSQIFGLLAVLVMSTFSATVNAQTSSARPLFSKWPYVSHIVRTEHESNSKMDCCKKAKEACSEMDCCK